MARFGKIVFAADDGRDDPAVPGPENPQQREDCVRNDLLNRLKGVCKDMSEEEFHELVAAMTREQLRSERML